MVRSSDPRSGLDETSGATGDLRRSTRRTSLFAGLVLVVLGTAAAAVLLREDDDAGPCAVLAASGETRPQLVDRDDLLPTGSVGDERREVVEAVEGLGGPVGSVVTGRFFEQLTERPGVVAYGERLALVSTPAVGRAAVDVVEPDSGGTDWRVDLTGRPAWTTFTGGPVGSDLVLAFAGMRPTLLALADDSAPVGCHEVARPRGAAAVQVRTDQAGTDVVVAAVGPEPARRRSVSLVDPVSGERRWTVTGEGPLASVTVVGDLVLLARADSATAATEGLPLAADGAWLEALSLEDGSPRWSVEETSVHLTTGPDGTSYLLQVGADGPRLIAVGADGQEQWSRRSPAAFRSAWLWEDRLVLRGPDPDGGPMLRAHDVATGEPAWQVRSRQAPAVGQDARDGFGTALVEDGTAWVPAPSGLLEVDVDSGALTRHDSTVPVDQILRVGDPVADRVVVVSGTALLVTR